MVGAAMRLLDGYMRVGKSAIFHGVPIVPCQFARYRSLGAHLVLLAARNEDEYCKRFAERAKARAGRFPSNERVEAGWILHQHLVADATACGVPIIAEATPAKAASSLLKRISS
jgi:2-phosphoglycerate kinase